jgi:hypothetical protein
MVFKSAVERNTAMTRHLELATILEHATGTERDPKARRRPVLFLAWSLDRQTGKPVAHWVAATHKQNETCEAVGPHATAITAIAAQSGRLVV